MDCLGECFGFALDESLGFDEGNNLISFYSLPEDVSLENVFEGLDLGGILGEGNAAAYINDVWYGGLDEIDASSGYWLQSNIEQGIEFCGTPSNDITYTLHEANNLISYPYSGSQGIGSALPDGLDLFAIVGEGVAAINLAGNWAGSLDSFDGGSGYWFARSAGAEDVTFQYNAPGAGNTRLLSNELPVVPDAYEYVQSTEQGFYFVESLVLNDEPVNDNNWIVAYNNDIVVGARMWNGEYTDIPAMGNDGSIETVGYMEVGNIPSFKLFNSETGSIIDLYVRSTRYGISNNPNSICSRFVCS